MGRIAYPNLVIWPILRHDRFRTDYAPVADRDHGQYGDVRSQPAVVPDTLYKDMLENYKNVLTNFIGPTTVFVSGETMQVKDYSKFNWTFFDGPQRVERREKVFPQELKKAFDAGSTLFG
jgi:hypothetical protein